MACSFLALKEKVNNKLLDRDCSILCNFTFPISHIEKKKKEILNYIDQHCYMTFILAIETYTRK